MALVLQYNECEGSEKRLKSVNVSFRVPRRKEGRLQKKDDIITSFNARAKY